MLNARSGVLAFLVFVFVGLAFFAYNYQVVIVSGESMLPALSPDQKILVCKALWAAGLPTRGDIVVIDTEDGFIVKRVAYLPGDEVDPENRPFEWPIEPKFRVPENMVYVLGDNLMASEDSRAFGPVRMDRIIGKAVGLR
jgi:signal peptidase I